MAHFRVKGVSFVAVRDERITRLRVERLRSSPHAKPREPVGFGEQLMRFGNLRDSRGVLKKREQRTDDADQVKTVARHDSLPRFAGAPLIFYNRVRSVSRSKNVIPARTAEVRSACPVGSVYLLNVTLTGRVVPVVPDVRSVDALARRRNGE